MTALADPARFSGHWRIVPMSEVGTVRVSMWLIKTGKKAYVCDHTLADGAFGLCFVNHGAERFRQGRDVVHRSRQVRDRRRLVERTRIFAERIGVSAARMVGVLPRPNTLGDDHGDSGTGMRTVVARD
jgi:hypothetical protein